MKKESKTKTRTKSKANRGSVIINNTNKVVIQNPKRRANKKRTNRQIAAGIPSQNYPVVNYFNPEPIRKETPNELLNLAQNYISPPQIMNTPNQEEEKDLRLIESKPKPKPKPKVFRTKTITEQIYKRPSLKTFEINKPSSLKKLGVKDLRKLGKANGVPEEIIKQLNLKSKNKMIDDHFKGESWFDSVYANEETKAGGAVLDSPKFKTIKTRPIPTAISMV